MHKSIGILGGMGPMATADLFQKIVALTKADSDNDHIRIYIDNNPQIPDRTTAILKGGKDPVPQMLDALRHLEACGADCIVMPCNTAHYFLDRLQPETKIPFISILESTAKACAAAHPGRPLASWPPPEPCAPGFMRRPSPKKGSPICFRATAIGRFSWMGSIGSKRGSG